MNIAYKRCIVKGADELKVPILPRWLSNPILQLSVLGVLSWLAYLHLATTYPLAEHMAKYSLADFGRASSWKSVTAIDFILTLFGALLFCLLAWLIVRKHPHDKKLLWVILGFAALFALTLVVMYPIGSSDVFEYVFHSRILTHYGQNPLVVAPIKFKGDPFLKSVPWALHPSPYGPLWVLLTVPGSLLGDGDFLASILLMKLLNVPFFLGCIVLIAAILKHLDRNYLLGGALLFAWNPLLLFEPVGNGHNGIVMVFLALLAIYLVVRRKWVWVIPVLLGSVLIKWVTAILLLPFLIYCWRAQPNTRARWIYLAKTSALSALMLLVLILPFLEVPTGLLEEANFYSLLALPSIAYYLLRDSYGQNFAKVLTMGIGSVTFAILYLFGMRFIWNKTQLRQLILLTVFLIIAYLGIACVHFQPWFVVWPLALGIWFNHAMLRPVLIVFTGSALFAYAANFWWIWNYKLWGALQTNLTFVAVIFLPPIFIGLLIHLLSILIQLMHSHAPSRWLSVRRSDSILQ